MMFAHLESLTKVSFSLLGFTHIIITSAIGRTKCQVLCGNEKFKAFIIYVCYGHEYNIHLK